MRVTSVATQTDDELPAAPFVATASPAATFAATPANAAPAPVFEYVAPAPVMEKIAPAPAVILLVPSEQLPPVFSTATVATDVNLDITSLVSQQFSSTAVETSAPQVIGSHPPFEVFTEPVYNQVRQEQIVAGEMTQKIIEHSAVQEQVIVREILPVSVVERMQAPIRLLSGYKNKLPRPSM